MKAMMTAMMTAAIKRCLFIFLPLGLSLGPRPRRRALGGAPAVRDLGREGRLPERAGDRCSAPLSSSCFQMASIATPGRAKEIEPWGGAP